MSDTDDTTYLESAAVSSTVQTLRMRVKPMAARSGLSVIFRLRKEGTGSCIATPRLEQGTTSKGSLSPITITNTWTDYQLDLTSGQIAAITDWGDLHVEIDVTS